MANFDMQEALSLPPYHPMQIKPLEGHETQCLGILMSTDMRAESVQKRCVPTPRRTKARPMTVGTWQTDFLMAIGMQQTGIRPIAIGVRHSGDNLSTKAKTDGYRRSVNGLRSEGRG